MMRFIRSAFVIARRDFTATVLSKAFIFFLLGPLFPLLLGGLFGGIGAQVASRVERPTVAVAMSSDDFAGSPRIAIASPERLATPPSVLPMCRRRRARRPTGAGAEEPKLHAQGVLTGTLAMPS